MIRHIVNLKFGAWKWRVYLAWSGEGSGDDELAEAMREVESVVGPAVSGGEDFLTAAQQTFKRRGFDVFKG